MKRQWVRSIAAVTGVATLALVLISCAANPQKAKRSYLEKGDAYMKQKQYSSAIIEYRNALKVDPRYTDAYYQLAKADVAQANADHAANKTDATVQDFRDAFKALTQGISVDPNRVDLRLARAAMIVQHDPQAYSQASDDLNHVLTVDPKNANAHRGLGTLFMAQKQYDQALQEFSKAAALDPKDAASYVYMGVASLQLHHSEDAELNFKKAIQVEPHTGPAYVELANLYLQQKNPTAAAQILHSGISANPSIEGLYVLLADIYAQQQKDFAQAAQTLQSGIRANPSSIPLYLRLAALFKDQGKQSDVESTLTSLSSQLPKSVDAALAVGNFYRSAKMNDRALTAYQAGLSANPGNLALEHSMEDIYLTDGQIDQAASLNAEMLKQSPNDTLARTDRGRLLMAQGKISDALDTLQKASTEAATSPEAHYYLAIAYLRSNNPAQASSAFQQALAQANSVATTDSANIARMTLAQLVGLNLSQGKGSVAQLYAQELLKDNPTSPTAHLLMGDTLANLGQLKAAEKEYVAAQGLAPQDPVVQTNVGLFYAREKKFPEAEQELKSALQAAPSNLAVLTGYANILLVQKKTAEARALVTQFLAKNPNDAGAHLLMGRFDLASNNMASALSETQESLRLDPKNVNAYLQVGQIYQDQSNNAAAIQAYEQAAQLSPSSAPILTKIGNIYMGQGDLSKAATEFQKALNVDPTFMVAANNLAWVYAEQGQNLDVALGLAQKAKAQNPGVPSFSDTLAWVMFRRGDYASAIPLLQECVKRIPDSAQFHYHLGMVLVSDGQKTAGKAQLQAALEMKLDPQDAEQARKALAQ